MIRYSYTGKAVAKVAPVSETELIESIEAVSAAAVECVECGIAIENIVQCMDNVQLAMTAIKNGGLTKQVVSTFNGSGELSAFLGQESLTVAGLESFADAQVKALEGKYIEGLEGKMAEYWNKFVAWLKNLWIKMKNWFATAWQNRAKWFKSLDGVKTMKEFNGDAEVNVVSNEAYNKLYDLQQEIVKGLDQFKKDYTSGADRMSTFDGAINDFNNKLDEILKDASKSDKLTQRGWNLQKLQAAAANVANASAANGQMANCTKWVTGALELLVKKAGEAGKSEDAAKKEAVQAQRKALASALAAIRLENRIVNKMFTIAHTVMKAAQTPAKKSESK